MQQQNQQQGSNILVQGRIVWGGVKPGVKRNYQTKQPVIDPKTGKEVIEWAFGLAIPKPSPQSQPHEVQNAQTFWNTVQSEAAKVCPQGVPRDFHWKFEDGDGTKKDGSPFPEHSKGCFIIACKTQLPLKLFAWEAGQLVQITEDQIKCGDYVQVQLNILGHGGVNAGMYINPSYVARVAHGQEIVNTPDPTTIFGNQAPPMPMGGSATPQAPQGLPMGGMMQMGGAPMQGPGFAPQMQPQQQPMQMSGMSALPQTQQPVQPNYGVLPPHMQPQQQQAPQQPMQMGGIPQMPTMPEYNGGR